MQSTPATPMCLDLGCIFLLVLASACLATSLCKLCSHLVCSYFLSVAECRYALCCKIFMKFVFCYL